MLGSISGQIKHRVSERYEAGQQKAVDVAVSVARACTTVRGRTSAALLPVLCWLDFFWADHVEKVSELTKSSELARACTQFIHKLRISPFSDPRKNRPQGRFCLLVTRGGRKHGLLTY